MGAVELLLEAAELAELSGSSVYDQFCCTHSYVSHYSAQIIFRFALSLFKYKEEEFLKLQDSTTLFKYLRYFTRTILDSRYRKMLFALD